MKTIIVTLTLLLSASISQAADFNAFLMLFEKAEIPYTVPEGAYMDYGNEEFEPPFSGKSIDGEMSVAFLGAYEDGYTQYEAVTKFEMDNYVAVLIFETDVNMNSGAVSGSFVLYSLSKTGEFISSVTVSTESYGNNDNYYKTYELNAVISKSEWPGDEGKLLITYQETQKKNVMDGKYGMIQETKTTLFDLIEADGKIKGVTTKIGE